MTAYERQLRAVIAALMATAPSLTLRNAQIQHMDALLNIHDVATLLNTIDELRAALESAKNGLAWYRDAHPEDDSGADDEMMNTIDEALGVFHLQQPRPAQASICGVGDIPPDVTYNTRHQMFYQASTGKSMGHDFYVRWAARSAEFPQVK